MLSAYASKETLLLFLHTSAVLICGYHYYCLALALASLPAAGRHLPTVAPLASVATAYPNLPILPQISISFNTEPTTSDSDHLSPRALEKQPERDAPDAPVTSSQRPDPLFLTSLTTDRPPVTAHAPIDLTPSRPQLEAQSQRRSFLEALLARQKRAIPADNRSATSRILNPINYVPRPTRVRVQPQSQPQHQCEISTDIGTGGEVHTLLTLPEQRRSRQHSPTDPIVEHSPHLAPQASNRTSIGLPPNQQRGNIPASPSRGLGLMVDPEKQEHNGIKEAERAHTIPTSRYNPQTRDLESQQGTSVLAQTYGVNPLDQLLQPPRRITSHRSLKRAQSTASIHSSAFARTNADGVPPVPGSRDDVGQGYPGVDEGSVGEELVWGPSHPCFPHQNPHVPLDSPEYSSTRIIRIRRDWMVAGDLAPTYSNIYPEILDPLMQEQEFRYVIEHINQTLVQAYDPFSSWNWLDGFLGLITGWLWEDFRPTGIKGQLKALEEWLEDWNHTVGAREGVKIIPLRRTGYLNLDIQIPDPQVRVVGDGDAESQQPPSSAVLDGGGQQKLP
ncbi:hypothetical protein LTS07_002052 [Exophiala sideris]|uniref:Ras modification protein ERF4 n=1 Tax=Exophiala sideris TaxID=1016849 RepID=A0ABR0JLR6_9EURO|nr:hypothetical protein LTS07_002052 [Exophiala sideris]KAK5041843.1 hypothetical protein LTR13_002510 [Exophiala sideris]KAK5066709.1 hypothetical protein LTR69_002056 [Exophiala sideris]KAK5184767.1 hypothetical protein LTR44_002613 [Eurotiomycetes sp. CCFEE 6388]